MDVVLLGVLAYAAFSITVTIVLWRLADRRLSIGGVSGMTRLIVILVVAFAGVVIHGAKAAFGAADGTMQEEVSDTLRKASNGVEWLKEQWQSGKEG